MRVMLVGESPPSGMRPGSPAFSGAAGGRLSRLMGIDHGDLWEYFETLNVFDHHVPHESWRPREARNEYERKIFPLERGYQVVLLCGWNVARAAGCPSAQYFRKSERRYVDRYVFPHPSGKNRWYNEAGNRDRAAIFLRSLLQMD